MLQWAPNVVVNGICAWISDGYVLFIVFDANRAAVAMVKAM